MPPNAAVAPIEAQAMMLPSPEMEARFTYQRMDGSVEHAQSPEEAIRRCPVLGSMPVEQANVLLGLAAEAGIPKMEVRSPETANVEVEASKSSQAPKSEEATSWEIGSLWSSKEHAKVSNDKIQESIHSKVVEDQRVHMAASVESAGPVVKKIRDTHNLKPKNNIHKITKRKPKTQTRSVRSRTEKIHSTTAKSDKDKVQKITTAKTKEDQRVPKPQKTTSAKVIPKPNIQKTKPKNRVFSRRAEESRIKQEKENEKQARNEVLKKPKETYQSEHFSSGEIDGRSSVVISAPAEMPAHNAVRFGEQADDDISLTRTIEDEFSRETSNGKPDTLEQPVIVEPETLNTDQEHRDVANSADLDEDEENVIIEQPDEDIQDFDHHTAMYVEDENPVSLKMIRRQVDDQSLEETFAQLAAYVPEDESEPTEPERFEAVNSLLAELDELLVEDEVLDKEMRITPKITENLVNLMRALDSEKPKEKLADYVARRDITSLMKITQRLTAYNTRRHHIERGLSSGSGTNNHRSKLRVAKLVFAVIMKAEWGVRLKTTDSPAAV